MKKKKKSSSNKFEGEYEDGVPTTDDLDHLIDVSYGKEEKVNHPSHYNAGKYEVIDVIVDWQLNFNLGNAVKYIARCDHKGNKKEDLEKAIFYLKYELEHMNE